MQKQIEARLRELCNEFREKRPMIGSGRWRQLRDAITLNAQMLKQITGKEPDAIIFFEEPPCGKDKLQ